MILVVFGIILKEVAIATETVLRQCSYQTALVDSAEIEAAYENTNEIIGTVNNIDSELMRHDDEVQAFLVSIQATGESNANKLDTLLARQLEVIRLLHTPEGRRRSNVPACNGGPCSWPAN